jgi:cell wall-associated NlpC family hydrolase
MGMSGMNGMGMMGMPGMSGMGMMGMPGMSGMSGMGMTGMSGMSGMDGMMQLMSQMMLQMQLQMMQQMMQMMAAMSSSQGSSSGNLTQMMGGYLNGGANLGNLLSGAGTAKGASAPLATSSAATPQGAPTSKVRKFIDIACAQKGKPYVMGAEGPKAFDCSGLVAYALQKAGVKVGRTTARGYQAMFKNSAVAKKDLKPGDLIFYHYKNSRGIPSGKASHIEIYLGNGMSMGTDNPREGARIEKVDWNAYIGAARVPGLYK